MSEQVRESLSVLMDGEAGELDLARVLRHVDSEDIRDTWMRYHGICFALRQGRSRHLDVDISASVMAALDAEPEPAFRPAARLRNFLKPAAGFALVASLCAAAFVGVRSYGPAGGSVEAAPEARPAARVAGGGTADTPGGAAVRPAYAVPTLRTAAAPPRTDYDRLARERLRSYMLAHTAEASLNAPQGMMPYARVVSFQAEE